MNRQWTSFVVLGLLTVLQLLFMVGLSASAVVLTLFAWTGGLVTRELYDHLLDKWEAHQRRSSTTYG